MAVDTENKRFSFMSGQVMPSPDGAFNAADRAQLLGLYSGIALAAPTVMGYTNLGGAFYYETANWVDVEWYYEVYMLATAGTVYARLYDITAAAVVADSEVSTASATYVRVRTASVLTLVDTHEYVAQVGAVTGSGDDGTIRSARVFAE